MSKYLAVDLAQGARRRASSCAPRRACCAIEKGPDGRATGAVYRDRVTGATAVPAGAHRHPGRQRRRHAAAAAGLATISPTAPTRSAATCCTTRSSPARSGSTSRSTAHMGYVAAMISREFAETDISRGFVNGFNFNCVTSTAAAGEQAVGLLAEANGAVGPRPPRVVRAAFRPQLGRVRDRRRPAPAGQPGHAVDRDRRTRTACRWRGCTTCRARTTGR